MLSAENIYQLESYLDILQMYKMAFDQKLDMKPFTGNIIEHNYYYSEDDVMNHFELLVAEIFAISETYRSYDDGEMKDKKHWLSLCNPEHTTSESDYVIVILDEYLDTPFTGIIESDLWDTNTEIFPIDGGVVILYDSDYGYGCYLKVFECLMTSIERSKCREVDKHEMGI